MELKGDIKNLKEVIKGVKTYSTQEMQEYERQKEELFKRLAEEYDNESRKNKAKKYKDISIVDTKFYNSTFENADKSELIVAIKRYCDKFIETGTAPNGLYIHGGVGNGKTFATSCLANELLNNGKGVLFMNVALYLNKLRASFKENAENNSVEQDILNYVKQCDLLIIDDLGVENISPFVKEKLFNLIDTRYRTDKPLIVTSNLDLEELKQQFGGRIADRINGCTYDFFVKGESRRKIDKKSFKDWLMA